MEHKLFGISNIGNTCYLNSAVQLLCLNPKFLRMENISQNPNLAIKNIKNTLSNISSRFSGFSQEDSGEALLLLLEHYGNKFRILPLYEFNEKTRIRCKLMKCLHEEISNRKSNVLLLDIDDNNNLHDCYQQLKNSVKLEGENSWECPKCQESLVASKRFYFDNWSKYLIIGLKRFQYQGTRYVKNSNSVSIPYEWNHGYKLKGAIIHSGSINGGHYICVGEKNNKWYIFNDSNVSQITEVKVLNNYLQQSYFILYER